MYAPDSTTPLNPKEGPHPRNASRLRLGLLSVPYTRYIALPILTHDLVRCHTQLPVLQSMYKVPHYSRVQIVWISPTKHRTFILKLYYLIVMVKMSKFQNLIGLFIVGKVNSFPYYR